MNKAEDFIGKMVVVKMDRQLGSSHPKWGFTYLTNYGFIPNTISGDSEELDAYVLGISVPLEEFEGRCIAVIHRLDDNDDKLIVVPDGETYTDEQINLLVDYQEKFFKHIILR